MTEYSISRTELMNFFKPPKDSYHAWLNATTNLDIGRLEKQLNNYGITILKKENDKATHAIISFLQEGVELSNVYSLSKEFSLIHFIDSFTEQNKFVAYTSMDSDKTNIYSCIIAYKISSKSTIKVYEIPFYWNENKEWETIESYELDY